MKINYDPDADAIYIRLREGKIEDTIETAPYVYVDVDSAGSPIGIEILYARQYIPANELSSFTVNLTPAPVTP